MHVARQLVVIEVCLNRCCAVIADDRQSPTAFGPNANEIMRARSRLSCCNGFDLVCFKGGLDKPCFTISDSCGKFEYVERVVTVLNFWGNITVSPIGQYLAKLCGYDEGGEACKY